MIEKFNVIVMGEEFDCEIEGEGDAALVTINHPDLGTLTTQRGGSTKEGIARLMATELLNE